MSHHLCHLMSWVPWAHSDHCEFPLSLVLREPQTLLISGAVPGHSGYKQDFSPPTKSPWWEQSATSPELLAFGQVDIKLDFPHLITARMQRVLPLPSSQEGTTLTVHIRKWASASVLAHVIAFPAISFLTHMSLWLNIFYLAMLLAFLLGWREAAGESPIHS